MFQQTLLEIQSENNVNMLKKRYHFNLESFTVQLLSAKSDDHNQHHRHHQIKIEHQLV